MSSTYDHNDPELVEAMTYLVLPPEEKIKLQAQPFDAKNLPKINTLILTNRDKKKTSTNHCVIGRQQALNALLDQQYI